MLNNVDAKFLSTRLKFEFNSILDIWIEVTFANSRCSDITAVGLEAFPPQTSEEIPNKIHIF